MRIRAAVVRAAGETPLVETRELRQPGPGEVVVEVEATTFCPVDWLEISGGSASTWPLVPGHEAAGVVVDHGPGVTSPAAGTSVVLCAPARPQPAQALGAPAPSDAARGSLGTWATHAVVPAAACVPIVPLEAELATLIGCGLTTGAAAALDHASIQEGATVAVVGGGLVGVSLIMAAATAGADRIIVADPDDADEARRCGATDVIEPEELAAEILELTDGRGTDVAFDATGHIGIETELVRCVAKLGTAVVVGLASVDVALQVDPRHLIWYDKTLTGTVYGQAYTPELVARCAELVADGRLPLDQLDLGRFPLADLDQGWTALLTEQHRASVLLPGAPGAA